MRCGAVLGFVVALFCLACGSEKAPPDYPYQPVSFTEVKPDDSFWAPRLETNRTVTVPVCFRRCEETGRIDNFKKAAGTMKGPFRGKRYDDSDVFKVIQGAAYSLALHPDPELDAYLDRLIANIAGAQEDDGYLYTIRTIGHGGEGEPIGKERWSRLVTSHELYNVGHLYEAAVAHYRATGKRTLLDIAVKNADLVAATFGPGKRVDVPGHEEIELGLVKLYRVTGERKYLDLAKFFVDERGDPDRRPTEEKGWDRSYTQDHLPVREQRGAVGHAVRAGYFYSGVTDIAALTKDTSYDPALDSIWHSIVDRRIYLTGGIGAQRHIEGFGADYELPNDTAYNETCAAVASMLWNHRLFLLSGDARYIDVLERTIYNGFLSGVSLSGDLFFYPNPLSSDGVTKFNQGRATRAPWFRTACCPTNVVRTMPSMPGYVYATRGEDLYVNLFVGSDAEIELGGRRVRLRQRTEYPWSGQVVIEVDLAPAGEFAIQVRIPGWARGEVLPGELYHYRDAGGAVSLKVNGEPVAPDAENGYVRIARTWKSGDRIELDLPMEPRRVVADERVAADRGRVAIERGPLVYCVEGVDNGGTVAGICVGKSERLQTEHRPDLLGGVTVIHGDGWTAVPYYAWSNRGAGEMAVWLPEKKP